MLQDEEPAALANLRDVFEDVKPFSERVNVGTANVPEQEHSDPRVERFAQNAQLRLSPNAPELTSWSVAPTVPVALPGATNQTLPGGIMDKMSLTIMLTSNDLIKFQ